MCKNQVRRPQGAMLRRHIIQFSYSEYPVVRVTESTEADEAV